MQELISLLEEELSDQLEQIVLSNARTKDGVLKVKIRPVLMGSDLLFQFTTYIGTQVFHENLEKGEAQSKICSLLSNHLKQMQLVSAYTDASVLASKKGKITIKCKKRNQKLEQPNEEAVKERLSHNRKKQYL